MTAMRIPTTNPSKKAVKPFAIENLFLAMCVLLSAISFGQAVNVNYWAYIPNPPMLEPMYWGDMDLQVYTTPKILSPPWNDFTSLNINDGTKYNFTHSMEKIPICLGSGEFCLPLAYQHWLLPGINITRSQHSDFLHGL